MVAFRLLNFQALRVAVDVSGLRLVSMVTEDVRWIFMRVVNNKYKTLMWILGLST